MGSLLLTLFGGFQAQTKSGAAVALSSRKAQALLAYLALGPGEALRREKLMVLLWSDRGEEQARTSLRQTLTALRKGLDRCPRCMNRKPWVGMSSRNYRSGYTTIRCRYSLFWVQMRNKYPTAG